MRSPHRPRLGERVPPTLGVLLLGLAWAAWCAASVAAAELPVPGPSEGGVPWGRWRVAERGWGWESRLHAIEVRPAATTSGDAMVVAYERDAQGLERVWGSARFQRPVAAPSPARWLVAEWNSGSSSVLLQLRARADGKLTAVVRERARDRLAGPGDRVRQVVLEHLPADERAVSTAPTLPPAGARGRPEPGGSFGTRDDLAGVFTVGADGRGLKAVALPDGFRRAAYPTWSPDGRWIAFTAYDATGRDPLIRVVAAGGGPTVALAAGIAPTWSSDGTRLAYIASGKSVDGTDWNAPGRNDERIESVRLTGPDAGEVTVLARGLWPRWSPTDDRLAYIARREANWDVYLRSADGMGLTRLTDDPSLDTRPVWTSDGRALVFLSDRGNRWDLYRVDASGREPATRLTNGRRREDDATLAPDGRQVAFTDQRGRPGSSVVLLDLASGSVVPLLDASDGDREPAWSPDGKSIAFVSRRPGSIAP